MCRFSNCLFIKLIFCTLIYQIKCQNTINDQDIYRTTPEFIESRGFKSETHTVTTKDGYILTIFRIINPYLTELNQTKPVLLWHGILSSSDSWLFSRPGFLNTDGIYTEDNNTVTNNCNNNLTSTLAYTLAACGWDVWLANTRGNQYSNKHKTLSSSSLQYSDYTLTELGIYDKPAIIDCILNITNKGSITYIGHSLGTTSMFVMLSLKPDYERYINRFIATAPIAFMASIKSVVKVLAPFEPVIRPLKLAFGLSPILAELIGADICGNELFESICLNFNDVTYGSDSLNTDKKRNAIYMGNGFDKISLRVIAHYAQLINSNRFQQFNYPTALQNILKYGRVEAPDYPLNKIKSKNIVLINGLNDYLSDVKDIKKLVDSLTVPLLANYTISWPEWNHLDFQWAIYGNKYLNPIILNSLNSIVNNNSSGLDLYSKLNSFD